MIERTETVRNDLSPGVSELILSARRQAMAGELPAASRRLRDAIGRCEAKERGVVGMLLTELLDLDDQPEEAAAEFDRVVPENYHALPDQVRFAYQLNRELVLMDPLKGGDPAPFNRLIKRATAAGVVWEDYRGLVRAWDDIAAQRLVPAMEHLQAALFGAYQVGYWNAIRASMARYGRAALQAEELREAAEAAILAEDVRLAKQVAEFLVNRRDVGQVRDLVHTVQSVANLKRHFVVGCAMLYGVSDAIPDELVGGVASWLLPWASGEEETYRGTGGSVYGAWQVLETLGHRLAPEQAVEFARALVRHPIWQGTEPRKGLVLPVRGQMIKAACHLAWALLPQEIGWFAGESIPLALERRWDSDYPEVLNLLCHLADRGGNPVRDEIGKKLFAGEQRDYLQGQIAELFGQQFLPSEKLEGLVPKVCETHRLSVQRLAPGQEPKLPSGSIMQYTKQEAGGGSVVRSLMNMVDWAALVRQRHQLSEGARSELMRSAIGLILDSENLLTNRESLLVQVAEMADALPNSLIEEVVSAFTPLARGTIEVSPDVAPTIQYQFTRDLGRPEELQAAALVALARFAGRDPDRYRGQFEALLGPALIHSSVDVRRGAFAAFRDFPGNLPQPFLAVLMGTRDADPQAAITAFSALAEKQGLELHEYEWSLLLYSIRGAAQSANVRLRRHAAGMLVRRIDQVLPSLHEQARAVLAIFADDVCASVREEVRKA